MHTSDHVPVLLTPYFARALWGGSLMKTAWRNDAPYEDTSESWEVSAHAVGQSRIVSGPHAGKTLPEYIASFSPADFFGRDDMTDFPMLIKVIAPEKDLSVQVHPDDASAAVMTGGRGKTEAWIVLEAPENAEIIYGLSVTPAAFADAVQQKAILPALQTIPVRAGDVINIPAGMIHALTSGVVVYEIQQNSDTTYRVYDWDRVDAQGKSRPLHICEAMKVLKDFPPYAGPVRGYTWKEDGAARTALLCHSDFALERLDVKTAWAGSVSTCYAMTVVSGCGVLRAAGEELPFSRGETWMIPACTGHIAIEGECSLLMGSVMPWCDMKAMVLSAGATEEDLFHIAGWCSHD